MEIDFKDKKLRELCEQRGMAERKLGPPCARKLRSRLADLQASRCVADLVAGRPHPSAGIAQANLPLIWKAAGDWFSSRIIIRFPQGKMAVSTGLA